MRLTHRCVKEVGLRLNIFITNRKITQRQPTFTHQWIRREENMQCKRRRIRRG